MGRGQIHGKRAHYHAYGGCYAAVVDAFAELWQKAFAQSRRESKTLMAGELGILSGSGVAMWSEIFANAELHGYDRFLNNTLNNMPFLRSKGAFQHGDLQLHFWDQVSDTHEVGLAKPPSSAGFIFFVDDAMHTPAATRDTLNIFGSYMHKDGAYIIEDMSTEKAEGAKEWMPAAYEAWSCTEATEPNSFWLLLPNSTARPDLQTVVEKMRTRFAPLFDEKTLAVTETLATTLPVAAGHGGAKLLPEPLQGVFGVGWDSVDSLRDWLVAREENFGGFIHRLTCRDRDNIKAGRRECQGGDRMGQGHINATSAHYHAYGGCYAAVFDAFAELWQEAFAQSQRQNQKLMAGELGILSGSGVAIWSEIFANAELHGYDRFLNNTLKNMPFLRSKGAFRHGELQLHFWDQMSDRHEVGLEKPPASPGFIFFVDDAMHTPEPTRDTLNIFSNYMHKDGAYIIEDMTTEIAKGAKQWMPAAIDAWSCKEATDPNSFWLLLPNTTARPDLQPVLQKLRNYFVPLFDDTTLSGVKLLPQPQGVFGVSWESVDSLRDWLVAREVNFGGFIHRLTCLDRTLSISAGRVQCQGGDRMGSGIVQSTPEAHYHAYAGCYAAVFDAFAGLWQEALVQSQRESKKLMAGELGILSGSGVAMWSEIFANAELHGYDRFLNNTLSNMPFLRSKGAFQHGELQLHYWDQMSHKHEVGLEKPPSSAGFIFFIDDAMHTPEPTRDTLNIFSSYMHKHGAYIIEDMTTEIAEGAKQWMPAAIEAWSCKEATDPNSFWLLLPNTTARADLQPVVQKLRTYFAPLFDPATLAARGPAPASRRRHRKSRAARAPVPAAAAGVGRRLLRRR